MKKLLLLCAFCLTAFSTYSQTEEKKWSVGAHGGLIQYSGDIGSDLYKSDQAFYGFAGLSVNRYLGKLLMHL